MADQEPPRPSDEEIADVLRQLNQMGQSALVLHYLATIDDLLESIIIHRMPKLPKKRVKALFRGYGPFASLAVKIELAHAMEFIDDKLCHDLDLLRNIRNKFARFRRGQAPDA